MSEIAIKVVELGKQFRIGSPERYRTLRDTLTDTLAAPFRLLGRLSRGDAAVKTPSEAIWALKDVSFEVKHGQVIGVIGRNGAGKSTLLKILSRITEPTEGYAEIHGRVGSLLEVGTGFHPELTGRENIFLNGAILGMKKAEILRKFDEIVAFAEVEKFIDTAVKHYSSGMYMRLAFGVAAHLEPEILIVDEVLAVGDAQFQKKCLGKMGEVAKEGRTVVFVSHQMNQIRRLCDSGIWLENGQLREAGSAVNVISLYEGSFGPQADPERAVEGGLSRSQFVSWSAEQAGCEGTTLIDDSAMTFRFRVHVASQISKAHHGIALFNSDNLLMWAYAVNDLSFAPGDHELCYSFPVLPVRPGVYRWRVSLFDEAGVVDVWDALPPVQIHTPLRTHQSDDWQGVLNLRFSMAIKGAQAGVPQVVEL